MLNVDIIEGKIQIKKNNYIYRFGFLINDWFISFNKFIYLKLHFWYFEISDKLKMEIAAII